MALARTLGGLRAARSVELRNLLRVSGGDTETTVTVEVSDMSNPQPADSHQPFSSLLESPHYERLRSGLIRIFARRGCHSPEDLADETILRVTSKLDEIAPSYKGDPARYFYGVARNVYLEETRRPRVASLDDLATPPDGYGSLTLNHRDHRGVECLEHCMSELDPSDRVLITSYYELQGVAKIQRRKELADSLGLGLNALRLRAHRIRQRLAVCVGPCIKKINSM